MAGPKNRTRPTVSLQTVSLQTVSLQTRERLFDRVVVWLVACVFQHFAMTHDTALVDQKYRSFCDVLEPDHVGVDHAVLRDHIFVEVAEQREVQLVLVAPRLQREERVNADTEHFGLHGVQRAGRIAEGAHLFLARAAVGRREERQDDRTGLELLAQRDRLAILIGQREIGRLGAYLYGHRRVSLTGPLCGRLMILQRSPPHSGPSRAKRGKRNRKTSQGPRGNRKSRGRWMVFKRLIVVCALALEG